MMWLVWRQHRRDAAAGALAFVSLAGFLVLSTIASAHLLEQIAAACYAGADATCAPLRSEYQALFGRYHQYAIGAGMLIPALVGMFVGAPLLAREFEQGTHLLVWTQGITRRRWLLTKVGLLGLAVALASSALEIAFQFWIAGQGDLINPWHDFDVAPAVLVGYNVFGLALGIAAGAVIRRTLPAMAATLIAFAGFRIVIAQLVRPNYLPPLTWDVGSPMSSIDGPMWIFGSIRYVDPAGHRVSESRFQELSHAYSQAARPNITPNAFVSLHDYLQQQGVYVVQSYQPGSRLWLFQGIEVALFIAIAGILLGVTYRLVVTLRR